MKTLKIFTSFLAACCISTASFAQDASDTIQTVLPGLSEIDINWAGSTTIVPVYANNDYTVSSAAQWLNVNRSEDGRRLLVSAEASTSSQKRSATISLKSADGKMSRTITAIQDQDRSYETLVDKKRLYPTSSTASSSQGSETVDKLFDGNTNTLWHSSYSGGVSSSNPVTLTFNFSGKDRIDYMIYVPRTSGSNGIWKSYTVAVTENGTTTTTTYNPTEDNTPDVITWPEGITPTKIVITVKSGSGGYASGGELEFCQKLNPDLSDLNYFTDEICSSLREGVTQEQIDGMKNPFFRSLANSMFKGNYPTAYRVASYPCRISYRVLSDEWNAPGKYYSQIDNPTGINFKSGEGKVILVSGIPEGMSVGLAVIAWYVGKDGGNFDGGNPYTTNFMLHNGVNLIDYEYEWDGLGYIQYYADTREMFEQGLPDIKVHIVHGNVNGILTPDKTNQEMYNLCRNAANSGNVCIDLYGSKVQSVWTSAGMRDYCKASDGTSLGYRQYLNLLDSLIQWEHREIGFEKYNRIPANHTFAYTNYTYYMFQGGMGVSFHHNQEKRVLNCKTLMYNDDDAIWGLSHEWGHQHQMHPYLCWSGMSEVTNNIFSYYNVQHMGYTSQRGLDQNAITKFWNHDLSKVAGYSTGKAVSSFRRNIYESAKRTASLYSYSPDLRAACLAEEDSIIHNIDTDPLRSLCILDTEVGEILTPFILLGNYATLKLNYEDFYPDMFESLRQQDDLPGGSTIEKKDGFDKYELISAAQNSNKNNLYPILAERYPTSCWITENYTNEGRASWTDNSAATMLCFIRKASRLYGYNLFDFFERMGFLRTVAGTIGDYGNKSLILTKKMYDEFKADMKALEDDGTLKPLSEQMLYDMVHVRNFNLTQNDKTYQTPDIPN